MAKRHLQNNVDDYNLDYAVDEDINNSIAANFKDDDKNEGGDPPEETGKSDEEISSKKDEQPKEKEKTVDNDKKSSDNNNQKKDDKHEQLVKKTLNELYDGDETKRDEAVAVANLVIKNYKGDPLRAAKSNRELFKTVQQMKQQLNDRNKILSNPFFDKVVKAANEQGKTIDEVDENFVNSVLGTATSNADQPIKKTENQKQLNTNQTNLNSITDVSEEELVRTGYLDQQMYDSASNIEKQEMLLKARTNYTYNVLPEKMAERTLALSEEKRQKAEQEKQVQTAIDTNKERISKSYDTFTTKYDVDFKNNPDHARLYEEIRKKAFRFPDFDDEKGRLIDEHAFEKAATIIFQRNDIPLNSVKLPDNKDNIDDSPEDIYNRVLNSANSFSGRGGKQTTNQEEEDTSVDAQVQKQINDELVHDMEVSKNLFGQHK